MRRVLLDILACPHCQGSLIPDSDVDPMEHGHLSCTGCARTWPVVEGVPNFVEEHSRAREVFTAQWYDRVLGGFERDGQLYGHDPVVLMNWLFDTAFSTPPPGSWALDAGCGSGEKAAAVARAWPEINVLAMDIADSVQMLAVAMRDVKNLHVIQADINRPPIRWGAISRLWAYNVVNLTPDAKAAFNVLRRTLAPRGQMALWVYPHASENSWYGRFYMVRDIFFFGRGHLLSHTARLRLVQIMVTLIFPILLRMGRRELEGRLKDRPYVAMRKLSLVEQWRSFVFVFQEDVAMDHRSQNRREEVLGWMLEAGGEAPETDEQGLYWATFPGVDPITLV